MFTPTSQSSSLCKTNLSNSTDLSDSLCHGHAISTCSNVFIIHPVFPLSSFLSSVRKARIEVTYARCSKLATSKNVCTCACRHRRCTSMLKAKVRLVCTEIKMGNFKATDVAEVGRCVTFKFHKALQNARLKATAHAHCY